MSILRSTVLLPGCSVLQCMSPSTVTSNASYKCLSTRDSRYLQHRHARSARTYAAVAKDAPADGNPVDSWPETPAGQSCPNPYQIFAIARDEPYTKARFYELVKLYHPDKSSCKTEVGACAGHASISSATRLERYRLIVAAHNILSDPVKRNAYDRWGAGWAGRAEVSSFSPRSHREYGQAGPFTSWQERPESDIWSNATWEDWERWRRRHGYEGSEKEAQNPLYFQNSTFVSIIMVLAAVGSSLNYNRAESEGSRFLAARDAVHDQTSKDLRKVRQAINDRPKDERIDWFVRNREASLSGYGYDELREERAAHVLPPAESCVPKELRPEE